MKIPRFVRTSALAALVLCGGGGYFLAANASADTRPGKTTTVGGHFICDCTAPQDSSCSCIVEVGP